MQANPIKILIIEDEDIWATQLELSLESLGFMVAAIFTSATDALANIATIEFDMALLDINMDGKNVGITLGKMIHYTYNKPFIFITGSTDKHTADEAIEANPSAYLIKPVNNTSLFVAINNALQNFQSNITSTISSTNATNFFFVKYGNNYKKIEWTDVVALESEKKYTKVLVHANAAAYLLNSTLKKTQEDIVPTNFKHKFIQVNRAELVNIDYIDTLKDNIVITKQKTFDVTESYIKDLKKALGISS
jgi:DNA-binding LytR/AlgR family response regulator